MPKRMTATDKWDDPWFCNLTDNNKLFWLFMLDKCNNAGMWAVNFPLFSHYVKNFKYDPKIFASRIVVVNAEKWFIPGFIRFQYGKFNPTSFSHKSALALLQKNGLCWPETDRTVEDQPKGLISPLQAPSKGPIGGLQGPCKPLEGTKAKDKAKAKDKEEERLHKDNNKHALTSIQKIIRLYKIATMGWEKKDDTAWDRAWCARLARPAKAIIDVFGGNEAAAVDYASEKMAMFKKWAEKNKAHWSLEAVYRDATKDRDKFLESRFNKGDNHNGEPDLSEKMGVNNSNHRARTGGLTRFGT